MSTCVKLTAWQRTTCSKSLEARRATGVGLTVGMVSDTTLPPAIPLSVHGALLLDTRPRPRSDHA